MSSSLSHVVRYLCCVFGGAALGVAVCLLLMAQDAAGSDSRTYLDTLQHETTPTVLMVVGTVAALLLVLARGLVGWLSKGTPGAADWNTVRGVACFLGGAALGVAILLLATTLFSRHLSLGDFWFERVAEPLPLVAALLGAAAGVVALLLVSRRTKQEKHSLIRYGLRIGAAWLLFFAAGLATWCAAVPSIRVDVMGILRNEPFTRRKPLSHWLEAIETAGGDDRRIAVYALGDLARAGIEDERIQAALRTAVADSDEQVALTALYKLKGVVLEEQTLTAVGQALLDERKDVRRYAVDTLLSVDSLEVDLILPELCKTFGLNYSHDRSSSLRELIRKHFPHVVWEYKADSYGDALPHVQQRAASDAAAMRQIGPAALQAYREGLAELIQSDDPRLRASAAFGIGGLGTDGADLLPLLQKEVAEPANPFFSGSLPAALAMESIGKPAEAAAAYVKIIRDAEFRNRGGYFPHNISPWERLDGMPAEVRESLPEYIRSQLLEAIRELEGE